ncbi:hypothetical protein C8J56DRAFT_886371 [Mycena floridula]|nr:hypothetical protein C8J56DRAFT_886371 [Mycena floridula]
MSLANPAMLARYARAVPPKVPSLPKAEYIAASLIPSQTLAKPTDSRKLLVLDLNGTLVYRTKAPNRVTHPRPYLSYFFRYLAHPSTAAWLDSMVWSSARPQNVVSMLDKAFVETRNETIKDLDRVWNAFPGHSTNTTILLDDSVLKAQLQPYSHICIPEYDKTLQNARDDNTLLVVIGILEGLKVESNVTSWLRGGGLTLSTRREGRDPWFSHSEVTDTWRGRGREALVELGIK